MNCIASTLLPRTGWLIKKFWMLLPETGNCAVLLFLKVLCDITRTVLQELEPGGRKQVQQSQGFF